MNTKGQKGFSIVNIIMGVILFLTSFILFAEPEAFPAPIIVLPMGLALWILGAIALKKITDYRRAEIAFNNGLLAANKVCFVISCLIMLACTLLPIIAPMVF